MSDNPIAVPATSMSDELARLLRLAWPVALAHLGSMLLGVVDVVVVGQLGEAPLACVSLGHTYSFALLLPVLGLALGLDPLFAQAFGAGREDRASATLIRGLVVAGALCVPIVALQLLVEPILLLLQQPESLVAGAAPYTRIRTLAIVPFGIFAFLRQYLQGAGRMWPGTLAIAVGNIINLIANVVLVFGWLGAPELGVEGAAWATVLSTAAMAAILVAVVVVWRPASPEIPASGFWLPMWAMLGIAAPVGLQVGLEGWAFSISTVMVGVFEETWLAAHAVAITLASLAFMVPLGIGSAAATRVGNLIGAGQAWGRAAGLSVALGAGAMLLFATAFASIPRLLASPFVDSVAAVDAAALLLPVAAGFALFDGIQVVTFGVLRGAGDTTVPAVANVIGYYVVGLPVGALLAYTLGFGAVGVWVGLAVSLACVAVILLVRLGFTWRRGGYLVA